MPDIDELIEETAPLTAEEVLTFGPVVEAQVWTPMWLQESRAPIAVAAGRPKLGPVFNSDGVGKAVIIRPCMSRGRRIRGLPPIYTPQMLEGNAGVFTGWPMFTDHVPAELAATIAKHGRSVKELGGQVLKPWWQRDFVQEDDASFGYRKGGVLAEVWAAPLIRKTVDNNPNLLHTSINAWPTSGKPGPCPWRSGTKGMIIEGIRRQPQGSVDYVVRGGAGGKLLVVEGLEEEGAWPEVGEWSEDDRRLVVSIAERLYASPAMAEVQLPSKAEELKGFLQEHAPHLLPALEAASNDDDADDQPPKRRKGKSGNGDGGAVTEQLTADDVQRIVQESLSGMPTVEDFEQRLREQTDETLREREDQRRYSERACALIESAAGIPAKWKADLKARYSMQPDGPPATLLVESEEHDGKTLTPEQVLEARVAADLDHVRDLIAEATGKPRVTGEGARRRDPAESGARRASQAHWRNEFARMGLAESADKALDVFGVKSSDKVEG